MPRIVYVAIYLAGTTAAVILLNASDGNAALAILIWAVASLRLGWGTGQLRFALLALLPIPLAIPFGYPDHYRYSEPLPIWWFAIFYALPSACLIFATALIRNVVEARRRQRTAQ